MNDKEKLKSYWAWYDACKTCQAPAQAPCVDVRTLRAKKHKPHTLYQRHNGRHRFSKAERAEYQAKKYAEALARHEVEVAAARTLLARLPTFGVSEYDDGSQDYLERYGYYY